MKLASVQLLEDRHRGGVFGWSGKSTRRGLIGWTGCERDTTRVVQNGILI